MLFYTQCSAIPRFLCCHDLTKLQISQCIKPKFHKSIYYLLQSHKDKIVILKVF